MKCEQIDTILRTGRKDEVVMHVESCPVCRKDYLGEETWRLLAYIADREEGEAFWAQQRASVIAEVTEKKKQHFGIWFKYAAAILLPLIIVLLVYEMKPEPQVTQIQQPQIISRPVQLQETAYPVIDDIKNPDARYYKIELDSKTQVIMIVDSNLDL